ncbi:MAG: FAD-dependent oxidoreductase [Anaerolineae bacterium]|nr:FAD-dependent oxidoreductase [Anaerolineae bacterium]
MSWDYELAVIGAGPAGMEAALAASEHGVPTVMVDNRPASGGQFYMPLPATFNKASKSSVDKDGNFLRSLLDGQPVKQYKDTLVWGIFPEGEGWKVAVYGPAGPEAFNVRYLVLAAGAYDTPVPFPGWTLPGVMTAGGAQIMVKNQRVVPGKKALVSGSGPLILAVAANMISAGMRVEAVMEGARLFPRVLGHAYAAWGQWHRMAEGVEYLTTLVKAGTPYKLGWSVIEARGEERVEEVVVARMGANWKPLPGSEKTLAVDTLVIGYGMTPNTGLSRLIECRHEYDRRRGGWVPMRDETLQTSLPGVYVAGDMAGIGGAELARLEGRLSGLAVAVASGHLERGTAGELYGQMQRGLKSQRRFAGMLGALFTPGQGLFSLANDDTLVCRCEEITLGEVREAVAAGARTLTEVKMITRTGMGNCQGRMCERSVAHALVDALAAEQVDFEGIGNYKVRPPLHPLPVSVLAEAAED